MIVSKRCAIVFSKWGKNIRGVSGVPWGWVKFMCDGVG